VIPGKGGLFFAGQMNVDEALLHERSADRCLAESGLFMLLYLENLRGADMNIKLFLIAASTAIALNMSAAYGHVMLEGSTPANNAVLGVAPKSIDLVFGHPTKLVMLKLMRGKDSVPVTVDASAADSKTFSIALPTLSPGHYLATWSTLSPDGHPMKGTLSFTISAN
jgi:methionine-rich copper-binding protein CopC